MSIITFEVATAKSPEPETELASNRVPSVEHIYSSYGKQYYFDPYPQFCVYCPESSAKSFAAYANFNDNHPFPKWIVCPTAINHSRDLFRPQAYVGEWLDMLGIACTLVNTLGYLSMRNHCVQNIVYLDKWNYYLSKEAGLERFNSLLGRNPRRPVTWDMNSKSCLLRNQLYWWNVQNNEDTMIRAMEAAVALFDILGCPTMPY